VRSDAELIGRSLDGDDDAFVEVVRRHARSVSTYLVRRVGRGPAEDLLGEVWVAAFASRASYDRSFAEARPWLFGIARNVLRSHWRDSSRDDRITEIASVTEIANPWPEVDELIDMNAASRGIDGLVRPLRGLPADERDVLLLVAWEQLSVADAARALGIPAGTARYRLHRARTALRRAPEVIALLRELNCSHDNETAKEAL
jgi:RNA polymerase sigma factor (sigma-70 family)